MSNNETIFAIKDKIQRHGLNKWFLANCTGTLQYCTGVGKTRCGVLAALYLFKILDRKPRILIVVPTEVLRDRGWEAEFKKWNAEQYWADIECVCINTAYKWEDRHFDLVIADEIHNYLSSMFIRFFENNHIQRLLGLSAFIPKPARELLNTVAPICSTITTERAVELGLVAPFRIYNLLITMSNEEKAKYNRLTRSIANFREHKGQVPKHLVRQRASLLNNSMTKVNCIPDLVRQFGEDYGVVFSEATLVSDQITAILGDKCVSFHSKMTKKAKDSALMAYCDGQSQVRVISTPRALDEGADLPRIRYAIVLASSSQERQWIQRLGRIIRYADGKTAVIVRLVFADTHEYTWVSNSQKAYKYTFWTRTPEDINFATNG
jgi:superfamily II DNA or RNA helicase